MGGGKNSASFRNGLFVYPKKEMENELMDRLNKRNQLVSFLLPRVIGASSFLNSANFSYAFSIFLSNKGVDFDVFMRKLPYRLELIRPCTTQKLFLEMFRNIYNFKNSRPIGELSMKEEEVGV
jgi:hypothetical protein